MTTVDEIKVAIERLPGDQFALIHDWIVERDWEEWDARILRDGEAGRLDFLIRESRQDEGSGQTRPL
jgi:hypothetical protein